MHASCVTRRVSRTDVGKSVCEGVRDGGPDKRGMGIGRLGFFMAELGSRIVDVKPMTRRTTSFGMLYVFCTLIQLGGGERS